ncbi:MAG: bifunctional UDP-N-acetylglucosamine diphosphorylase/glucosamine-1-phosphate N-acetyltransferase GlmU [Alphaproteobacteria bacterium]
MPFPVSVIILAAGLGTRMQSNHPKVMHSVGGRPMLSSVLELTKGLDAARTIVVASPENQAELHRAFPDVAFAIQEKPFGTGHAVRVGVEALSAQLQNPFDEDILVLCGDAPLVPLACLQEMRAIKAKTQAAVVVLAMSPPDPKAYGRLRLGKTGDVLEIIEAKDVADRDLTLTSQKPLCNAGVLLLDGKAALPLLKKLTPNNRAQEYYLTDVVTLAVEAGLGCRYVKGPWESLLGVNSREDLALVEAVFQQQARTKLMAQGVTLVDPSTVYLSFDTVAEKDVTIHPFVTIGPGVILGEGAEVFSFSHLSQATLGAHTKVGPFCRLRDRVELYERVEVGNFVEIKESVLKAGSKAKHLSYVGNSTIGAKTNIGAGAVTCNYDGHGKHATYIGDNVMVGANTSLIAPLTIGDGALIGAGSTLTQGVPPHALAVSRNEQKTIPEGAKRFHRKKKI